MAAPTNSASTKHLALSKYEKEEIEKALKNLTPEQKAELELAFKAYDANGDGTLTLAEIAGVMHNLGQSPSIPELRSMINKVDANKDGSISFDEFVKLMALRNLHNQEISDESLQMVFKNFDKDKSGAINAAELKGALESLGQHLNWKEVEEMLKQADINSDGSLDFEEFRSMIHGKTAGRWGRLRDMMAFTSLWRPRITDPDELAKAREKARVNGKILKELTFIRHGQSEANAEYEEFHKDLFHWEPKLTEKGIVQAQKAAQKLKEQNMKIELIVASPLHRALQTATLVLEEEFKQGVKAVAHPLATEQVTGSDDVGSSPKDLIERWPQFDWSLMPDKEVWWWEPEPPSTTVEEARERYKADPLEEPWSNVVARAAALETWLAERPERVIAVVAHGDLLEAMTGQGLANAQSFMMEVKARGSSFANLNAAKH